MLIYAPGPIRIDESETTPLNLIQINKQSILTFSRDLEMKFYSLLIAAVCAVQDDDTVINMTPGKVLRTCD